MISTEVIEAGRQCCPVQGCRCNVTVATTTTLALHWYLKTRLWCLAWALPNPSKMRFECVQLSSAHPFFNSVSHWRSKFRPSGSMTFSQAALVAQLSLETCTGPWHSILAFVVDVLPAKPLQHVCALSHCNAHGVRGGGIPRLRLRIARAARTFVFHVRVCEHWSVGMLAAPVVVCSCLGQLRPALH